MSNQSYKQVYSWCETPPGVIKEAICLANAGSADPEYSYFHSQVFTEEDGNFTKAFPSASAILQPDLPSLFLMYNLASSSNGSTISSSGDNLQFINTVTAGSYKFDINFSIGNEDSTPTEPDVTIYLGDIAGAPYINATTGFADVSTFFEPFNTDTGTKVWKGVMQGVVDLPANAVTSIGIGAVPGPNLLSFGSFNVTVTRLQ